MAKNADLRKLLEHKLGIKRAQVYRHANDLANSLSISVSDAIYLLAAKNHINLQKQTNLSPERLNEIRKLITAATNIPAPQMESPKQVGAGSPPPSKERIQESQTCEG